MTDITFIAPDGTAIAGIVQFTEEQQPWRVRFLNPDSAWATAGDIDYSGDGPDKPDWDTLTVGDMPVFEDESGIRWLPHHLINVDSEDLPVDPDTGVFSTDYCQLASWETQLAIMHRDADALVKLLYDTSSTARPYALATLNALGAELASTRIEAASQRHVEMRLETEARLDIDVTTMAEPLPLATMQLYRALHDAFADIVDAPLDGRLVIEGDALSALHGMVKAISDADPAGEPMSELSLVDIRPLGETYIAPDDRMWPDIHWSHADQDKANEYGWELVLDEDTGCLAVVKAFIGTPGPCFADDEEAMEEVSRVARQGILATSDDAYIDLCKRACQLNGVLVEG